MKNFSIMNAAVFAVFSLLPLGANAAWSGRIFDGTNGIELRGIEELAQELVDIAHADQIVLGEKHNTAEVQQAEAKIVREVVSYGVFQGNFTLAWEFLNFSSQASTSESFERFRRGEIDGAGFLTATQGHPYNIEYVPVLEATKALGGELLGVNLSRDEKKPVVSGGIEAADPHLVPPGFEMGSAGYFERFVQAMGGGHATPEQIKNYYAAQCLTDDVMAVHVLMDASKKIRFLVNGSFHSDFGDGAVGRLKRRAPGKRTLSIKIVDASDYQEADLLAVLKDPKYGVVADYVYFVNEPKP